MGGVADVVRRGCVEHRHRGRSEPGPKQSPLQMTPSLPQEVLPVPPAEPVDVLVLGDLGKLVMLLRTTKEARGSEAAPTESARQK
jgi:hypothetical protein